jgi:hypothetical protein
MIHPVPGAADELAAFSTLQKKLAEMYQQVAHDPRAEHTVLVVPSLSLDARELAKISGVHHYEERLLFMLMLLRRPRTRMVFITSQAIHPTVIDYYLHLLSGVPTSHARRRLRLLDCADASPVPLSAKILGRPRLMTRLKRVLSGSTTTHMVCFNSSPLERTLAVQLGVPLYANDPSLLDLGTKSGCRETFRAAGVQMPDGFERLRDEADIVDALSTLKSQKPDLRRAVVKLNDGFSGEGNALFHFEGIEARSTADLQSQIRRGLPNLEFTAKGESWEAFSSKYEDMGGVVEEFIEGENKCSPSAQCRVNAVGKAQPISTHDQVLGGPGGQVFMGCTFPADQVYRSEVQDAGMRVAEVLASKGVLGRFATDFVSVPREAGGFDHYAIEVNLRKGGTTHPFLTLRFLTDGTYDIDTGEFYSQGGKPKYYYASDTLQSNHYKGLSPDDLIDIAVYHELHFHASTERGVVFHLMGALSEFGKLGVVCIGDNPQQAMFIYKRTSSVLNKEVGAETDNAEESESESESETK